MKAESTIQPGEVLALIRPRLVESMPGTIRGVVIVQRGRDFEALVLSTALSSQRQRLLLTRDVSVAVFVENAISIERVIVSGHKPGLVRILTDGSIVADEESGAVGRLQAAGLEAIRKPRPVAAAERLAAYAEPLRLLAELESSSEDAVASQLIYSELLVVLLRSRLVAGQHWSVASLRLLDECKSIDPALAAWIATTAGKTFTADLLPALRVRVKSVTGRFGIHGDAVTPARFGVEDIVTGMARQRAFARQQAQKEQAVSA